MDNIKISAPFHNAQKTPFYVYNCVFSAIKTENIFMNKSTLQSARLQMYFYRYIHCSFILPE